MKWKKFVPATLVSRGRLRGYAFHEGVRSCEIRCIYIIDIYIIYYTTLISVAFPSYSVHCRLTRRTIRARPGVRPRPASCHHRRFEDPTEAPVKASTGGAPNARVPRVRRGIDSRASGVGEACSGRRKVAVEPSLSALEAMLPDVRIGRG